MWIGGSIIYICSSIWCLLMTLGRLHTTMAQTTRYEWTFFKATVKWDTANDACIAEDSRLIKVDSKLKRNMVEYFKDQWRASGVLREDYWIGVYDSDPPTRSFSWADCSTIEDSSFHWASDEPDNPDIESCVRNTRNGGLWRTKECNYKYQFICEKELGACRFDDLGNIDIPASGTGYNSEEIQDLLLDECLSKCKGDVNIPDEICWAITFGSTGGESRCLLHKSSSPEPFLSQTDRNPTTTSYLKNCFTATSRTSTITEVQDSGDLVPNGCLRVEPPTVETTTEYISTTEADESTSTTQSTPARVTTTLTTEYTSTTEADESTSTTQSTTMSTLTTEIPVSSAAEVLTTPVSTRPTSSQSDWSASTTTTTAATTTTMNITSIGPKASIVLPTTVITEQHISSTLQDVSSTSQALDCACACQKTLARADSEVFIAKILETLDINTKVVSSYRRKYISIPDARVSAQSIGYAGTAILVAVFGGLFLSDMPRLVSEFKFLIERLRNIS